MTRTTVDLDPVVLDQVKELAARERSSIGRVLSDLASRALGDKPGNGARASFFWYSQPMHALIDLEDKDAVAAALEADR